MNFSKGENDLRKKIIVVGKLLIVPTLLVMLILMFFFCWSLYFYGGIRYGLDRLNGHVIVPIKSVVDLGEVEPGNIVTATFRIKNLSGTEVTIIGVMSTCRCSVSNVLPMKISAGKDCLLPVDSYVFSQESGSLVNKQVQLLLNRAHVPIFLTTTMTVTAHPAIYPENFKPILAPTFEE
jgi:hypothetical protein